MEAAVLRAVGKHALPGGLTAAAFQALDLDVILRTRKKGGTLFEKNGAFSMVWQSPTAPQAFAFSDFGGYF